MIYQGQFIYLQDSVAGDTPTLFIGPVKVPLPESIVLLWLKILTDFVQQRGLKANGATK